MIFRHFARPAGVAAALIVLAACSGPSAYVDRPWEINRDHPDFPDGPELAAGSGVTVCYKKRGSTPAGIRALAAAECGRFGLAARFHEQIFDLCPMTAPTAAVFRCSAAAGVVRPAAAVDAPVPAPSGVSPTPTVRRPNTGLGAADVSTTAKSAPFPTFLFGDQRTRPQ